MSRLVVPQSGAMLLPTHIVRARAIAAGETPPPSDGEVWAKNIMTRLGDLATYSRLVFGNRVLVAKYITDTIQGSTLYAADATQREMEYQGKAMLVLAKGHLAFKSDPQNDFGPDTVDVGDWIYCEYSAGTNVDLMEFGKSGAAGRIACKVLRDTEILGVIPHPESVY